MDANTSQLSINGYASTLYISATEIYNSNSSISIQGNSQNPRNLSLCAGGGNVGVGASANDNYKLYVNGDEYISNGLYFYGNSSSDDDNSVYIEDYYYSGVRFLRINAFGGLFVNSTNYSSDMRKKNVVRFIDNLSVDSIALAPIFDFTWKESKDNLQHVGTSAQYWQNVLPNSVVDMGEFGLSLDYNAITIASAVITARKVVDHERRIKELEKENERLRTEIEQLKAA